MPRAVQYDNYGGTDVLEVREVPRPVAGPGQVVVAVRAAGINPGEAAIRNGAFAQRWPSTFPSGQGSDFAGFVVELGSGVSNWAVDDAVLGFTHERASHAELVVTDAGNLASKPAALSWEQAGALHVVGTTAWAAVRALDLKPTDTVVVSGAAGGVGSLAVQLARRTGATVIGLAGKANHDWLHSKGVLPVSYGDGVADRIKQAAPNGVEAFLDTYGGGYVDLALELGVEPSRINTIIDFDAVARHGVLTIGNAEGSNAEVMAQFAALVAAGDVEMPIAATYALDDVQAAYAELEQRHTRGKIVLIPSTAAEVNLQLSG
ncbi:MAG: NADP-dependent oxidoreductase [Actinomycetota bacterium]|nr:NADP-dependent oxidoreductase [Actinomycetota bacterium]